MHLLRQVNALLEELESADEAAKKQIEVLLQYDLKSEKAFREAFAIRELIIALHDYINTVGD